MANRIIKKEYDNIKNYNGLVLITFKNGRRTGTISGLTYTSAITEIIEASSRGLGVLLYKKEDNPEVDNGVWEESYFRELNRIKKVCAYDMYNALRTA